MVTTESGLQYEDTTVGEGAVAKAGQHVTVHYTGWLYNDGVKGAKFDSSKDRNDPFAFGLGGGQVIKGWDEGVQGMKIGGTRTLVIPPQLGYGARGAGGVIPPNATLMLKSNCSASERSRLSRMSVKYQIVHTTVYHYKHPVTFGEHRVMFRPRDSHDLRVLATDLQVSPEFMVRMIQDPHSNSVALVQPLVASKELRIVCSFTIEHAQTLNLELPLAPSAEVFPFAYSVEERFDLEQYMRPHHDDPGGHLTAWARQFIRTDGLTGTRDLLVKMNEFIRVNFLYADRDEEGTQTPQTTLKLNSGSCRDFALLMMEAARRLGIATRFVSGYLYDPALDGGVASGTVGAGSTHAWLQAYLPGAGWVPFDPTNNLLGGNQLIRVGVARDPSQAAPIAGSWYGEPDDYIGMTVNVAVKRR